MKCIQQVIKRIKENINDINSRYLLIISENSINTFLLSSILQDAEKDYNFIIGSPFEQDIISEEYALKVLNIIHTHMEQDKILILKNLEFLYPSIYDLNNIIDEFSNCNNKIFNTIGYDMKKLMINCGKEEIQALVYNANKMEIKKENINDYFFE